MFIDKLQNVQITLYFDSDIMPVIFWLCADLLKDSRNLQPTMFSLGQNVVFTSDMPLAVTPMPEGGQVQIGTTFVSASATNIDTVSSIIKKVFNVFTQHNISFYRIGFITNYAFPKDKIKSIKDVLFKDPSVHTHDFQNAQLYNETLAQTALDVNFWKRYFTAAELTPDLLIEIDINTMATERHEIVNNKFITDFIADAEQLIRSHFEGDHVL